MSPDTDRPFDANQADVVEQQQPVVDDADTGLPANLALVDVDPADALDQYLTVPLDEEDWPASPTP
jgi:hypothetical protein